MTNLVLASVTMLFFSSLAIATPPSFPKLSGLVMLAFDRAPAFDLEGGEFINCRVDEPDSKKNMFHLEICDVSNGYFQMDRAGTAALRVSFNKVVYSQYRDGTGIKRTYYFGGDWQESVAGQPFASNFTAGVLEMNDGSFNAFIKSEDFDLIARLFIRK